MHMSFADYFADPKTGEPLRLEIERREGDRVIEGARVSSTRRYPIKNGVPRFVPRQPNYAKSFARQWKRWPRLQFESENRGKPMENHTRRMWERVTGWEAYPERGEGRVIADIGCGPGRFIEIAREKGYRVIGLDYSEVVDVAAANFKHNPEVCIVQGDALNLPFKTGALDAAFTTGVLHHTPDPRRGVEEICRAIKSGGWASINVYVKNSYYDNPKVQAWRRLFNRLWPVFGPRPALLYAFFAGFVTRPLMQYVKPLGRLIRFVMPYCDLPDRNWTILDTFDSVTPVYQSSHTNYEVYQRMKKAGFIDIEPTSWGFCAHRGRKA